MAIKVSNQITFTEHKKIIEIKEWYLATPKNSGVTASSEEGWTLDIQMMDKTNKYLWNYEETVYSLGLSDITDPVIIGVYGETGQVGASLQVKYISSKNIPVIINNDISEWHDEIPVPVDGEKIYMIQKLSTDTNWSTPIQISGSSTTTEIIDGYWYINGDSTGVKAEGDTPEITIGEDGYWYINGVQTQTKAQGETGKDGTNVEYVYYLSKTSVDLNPPSYNQYNELPDGWTTSPQGISEDNKFEYVSIRIKPSGEDWGVFSKPVIWSKWGEKGQDGDGVAYEYYRCNERDVSKIPQWSESSTYWTDDPSGVSAEYLYEYVVQLTIKTESGVKTIIASQPSLWAKYGETGASLQIKYISSTSYPTITNNDVSAWSDEVPPHQDGYRIYMTQKLSIEINWSEPIQISGVDGSANVSINDDGYWVINGEVTGVKAEGSNGETPKIEIIDGYWVINDGPTGIRAEGEAGKDGSDIEYVYYRNNTGMIPDAPSYNELNELTSDWFASPQGIDEDHMYEFVSVRTKKAGDTSWSVFSTPVIWSKWGEKGQDGDGVEYKYYLSNSNEIPEYKEPYDGWYDDPQGVTKDAQYEYVIQIKTIVIDGEKNYIPSEKASLWAKFGVDGKGISDIVNYYATTKAADNPPGDNDWKTNVTDAPLTPTDKYLWNYEHIFYTDGDEYRTEPAIIGAYGDSGTDAVDFQIYSTDGFEFSDNVKSIKLNTVAFKAGNKIGSNLSYQWYYYDAEQDTFIESEIQSRTYSLEVSNETAGRQIYCVITDENGNSVQTETVTINMITSLSIVEQPTDVTVADGETAKTTVVAEGDGLQYQWYIKSANDIEFSQSSVTNDTYSYVMDASNSGRKAYCVITDENGNSITTDVITFTMSGAVKITKQPSSVSVSDGKNAKTTVTADGTGLTYQWYVCDDNSNNFSESSITSKTYSCAMNASKSGRRVYCVVTDENGASIQSDTVTLGLLTSLTILNQPKSVTVKEGEIASVTVSMSGDGMYQWQYWDDNTDGYEDIAGEIETSLLVDFSKYYALSELRCVMVYDGITYEDHISLTQKTYVYTAIAKFFDNNNIITANEEYLIVYVELYKDNNPEEQLYADDIYISDTNIVSDNVITTNISGTYADGSLMYFVCETVNDDNVIEYDVVLGKYESSEWHVVENNYIYKNDLFINTTAPVVFIPKEKITRSIAINFEVYENDNIIARTNAMVLDLNDPTISGTAPVNPKEGQLWLDTSVSPSVLKMWDGTGWVNSGYQNGNVVYTSKPENGYTKGDLWILESEWDQYIVDSNVTSKTSGIYWVIDENSEYVSVTLPDDYTDGTVYYNRTTYGEGSMLKANTSSSIFDDSHWDDVDKEGTEQKKNIKQYFLFNADTGLRIGQSDDLFYVNISSTEMGFYDATSGTAQKVVSISNQSATIKNLTVDEGARFNCEVQFGNFILKTESNGSLSLALAT